MLKNQSGAVDVQSVVLFKNGRGNRIRWRCGESVLPTFDPCVFRKVPARVFLRQNAGSGFVQPLVAAGVIKVPMSVYQLLDGVHIDARQGRRYVRTRGDDLRIHQQLSVRAGENGNISARPVKNADITTKCLDRDLLQWWLA